MTRDLRHALDAVATAASARAGEAPTELIRARARRHRVAVRTRRGAVGAGTAVAVAVVGFQGTRWTAPEPSQTAPPAAGWDCGELAEVTAASLLDRHLRVDAPVAGAPGATIKVGVWTPDDDGPTPADADSSVQGHGSASPVPAGDGVPAQTRVFGDETHILVLVVTDLTGRVVAEGARRLPDEPSFDSGWRSLPQFGMTLVSCDDGAPLAPGDYLVHGVWRATSADGTTEEVFGASMPMAVGDLTDAELAAATAAREEALQAIGQREAKEREDERRQEIIDGLVAAPTGTFPGCASVVPAIISDDVEVTLQLGHGDPPQEPTFGTLRSLSGPVVLDGHGAAIRVVVTRDGVVVAEAVPAVMGDAVGRLELSPGTPVVFGLPPIYMLCGADPATIAHLPPGTYQVQAVLSATIEVAGQEPRPTQLRSEPVEFVVPDE